MSNIIAWIFCVPFLIPFAAQAKQVRSNSARYNFVKTNPCPATGKPKLPCPGYIIDHEIPLCAGGADHPGNMQWQTKEDAKLKDVEERSQCRAIRGK